jgi:hypothetical protein
MSSLKAMKINNDEAYATFAPPATSASLIVDEL